MKTTLTADVWTEVTTTTVDTSFSSPNGRVKLSTEDPDASGFADGSIQLNIGEDAVIPAGLTVWAYPVEILYGRESSISYQAFGV